MYCVIGLGLLLPVLAAFVEEVQATLEEGALDHGSLAFKEYLRYSKLFDKWRANRPSLNVRQCDYATALVLAMISSYERYVAHRDVKPHMEENILRLETLLEEIPPHEDPPQAPQNGAWFLS